MSNTNMTVSLFGMLVIAGVHTSGRTRGGDTMAVKPKLTWPSLAYETPMA